jgi:AI-2 transport protein TqsA
LIPENSKVRDEQIWLAVGSLMVLATVALAGALLYTRAVMIPFVLAILITTVVAPLVDFQVVRWHLPGWVAITVALILVLGIMTVLGTVLVVAVQAVITAANEYSQEVTHLINRTIALLKAYRVPLDESMISNELKAQLPGFITGAFGTMTTLMSDGLLITFFVIFLLVGRDPFKRRIGIYAQIETAIRGYVTTLTGISTVAAVLVGVILWALGMKMAWLFAILTFLLNFIPNVGPIIACLLPLPIALTQFNDPWMIVAVIGLPGTIHMLIGNFIEPKLMGRGLELHPVTVLMALAVWGLLWGIVGMVLAVPIVATIKMVLERSTTTRPLAELLAGRLPGSRSATEVTI